jgi:hypothetical protein
MFLAVFVIYTPQLESIDARVSTTKNMMGITWVESIQHSPTHAFEHLRSITVDVQSASIDLNILLQLPSLRMLDVDGLFGTEIFSKRIYSALPTGASNVEVLKLRSSSALLGPLIGAVKACRKLRTFLYHL